MCRGIEENIIAPVLGMEGIEAVPVGGITVSVDIICGSTAVVSIENVSCPDGVTLLISFSTGDVGLDTIAEVGGGRDGVDSGTVVT